MTEMNLSKLKNIEAGIMHYQDNSIIIALKIPEQIITLPTKIILPIPNLEKHEIDLEPYVIITYNGKEYKYDNQKNNVSELVERNDCIIKQTCWMKYCKNFEIIKLNERIFVVKNVENVTIQNHYDSRNITLQGNYIINIQNCNLRINDAVIQNKETNYIFQLYYEEIFKENAIVNTMFEQIKDLQEIDQRHAIELKQYHRIKTYVFPGTLILIATIIIAIIVLIICKNVKGTEKIKIKINNVETEPQKHENLRENVQSEEGGVKYWS